MTKEGLSNSGLGHELFDRRLVRLNRKRSKKNLHLYNFLYHEIAERIAEDLNFFNRDFEAILEIGSRDGYLSDLVRKKKNPKFIFQSESYQDAATNLLMDDEFLCFKPASFDLVLSNLNFHFINLIPQFLLQVKQILKPGGIFIASFFGEENLKELSRILCDSENEIYGRVSPRMSPTIDIKTAANLLVKAGFSNSISDSEKIEVTYKDPMSLLQDLKMMGQGNALTKRSQQFASKRFLKKISENYEKLYSDEKGIVAGYEIVMMVGSVKMEGS